MSQNSFPVGAVVTIPFPFSNLKGQKIRPALVLAQSEFDDLILCQITSKPFSSKKAIQLVDSDFKTGKLPVVSYIRPNKLFTAHKSLIKATVGILKEQAKNSLLTEVHNIFKD